MSGKIESAIVDCLHQLDERHQSEVLDFVRFLVAKASAGKPANSGEATITFDPMRYSGKVDWPVDGLEYQQSIRKEWE